RGASASWAPKNLNSRLVMYACKWMVKNTSKRVFVAYSDQKAGEIGTIYQACNFDYLGNKFGNKSLYKLPNGKKVGGRYFTRTASMKKWAKELNISWQVDWTKENGYQNIKNIPDNVRKQLLDYAKQMKNKCGIFQEQYKGKYVLIL